MSAISRLSYNWVTYAFAADEWFAGAICAADVGIGVHEFMIGHAIELYLKGYHFKLFKDSEKTLSFRHDIRKLWRFLKDHTEGFMPSYELREHIFKVDFIDPAVIRKFSLADRLHYSQNQSLYRMMRYLPDLKYEGLHWQNRPKGGETFRAYATRDPYWITFFREMRRTIGYPQTNDSDWMKFMIERRGFSDDVKSYLKRLYE